MYRCVYAYCDPRKPYGKEHLGVSFAYEPFYIGKGTRLRVRHHLCPSVLRRGSLPKSSKILKLLRLGFVEIPIVICREFDNDEEASLWEQKFIKDIGRNDLKTGPLTNLTDGGEGAWSMSDSVKIKRSAMVMGITEEEYKQHRRQGEKFCPNCESWKMENNMMSTYCKTCWNGKAKQRRWIDLISKCGGNEKIALFYKSSPVSQTNAKKNKISLIDYYEIIQRGKRYCGSCRDIKDVDEMFNDTMCRCCKNKYQRNFSKRRRDYEGRLKPIQDIVGDKLAEAVLQSALRQSISTIEYAKHINGKERYCSACSKWLPIDFFWKRKDRVLGYQSRCKQCWEDS